MPAPEEQPRNRLSIAHLMLWMLGTAIALGLYRLVAGQEQLARVTMAWNVYALVYALLAGPKIGGMFLAVGRRLAGRGGFPTQPGHWLLAIEGMSTVLVYLGMAVSNALEGDGRQVDFGWSQMPNCVATAVAYSVAYRQQPAASPFWKTVFVILMAQHAYAGLLNLAAGSWVVIPFMPLPSFCISVLLVVFYVLAAVRDPDRRERDYLHSAGLLTVMATEVVQWAIPMFIWGGMLFQA